jgi:hypothetical protein
MFREEESQTGKGAGYIKDMGKGESQRTVSERDKEDRETPKQTNCLLQGSKEMHHNKKLPELHTFLSKTFQNLN